MIRVHMTTLRLTVVITLAIAFFPHSSVAGPGEQRQQPEISADKVILEVHWSGWKVRLLGNGWLGFVGGKGRTDLKHVTVEQVESIAVINDLLQLGYWQMPAVFPSRTSSLELSDTGGIFWLNSHIFADGGGIQLSLVIGGQVRHVKIEEPISTAPQELVEWVSEFEEFALSRLLDSN